MQGPRDSRRFRRHRDHQKFANRHVSVQNDGRRKFPRGVVQGRGKEGNVVQTAKLEAAKEIGQGGRQRAYIHQSELEQDGGVLVPRGNPKATQIRCLFAKGSEGSGGQGEFAKARRHREQDEQAVSEARDSSVHTQPRIQVLAQNGSERARNGYPASSRLIIA